MTDIIANPTKTRKTCESGCGCGCAMPESCECKCGSALAHALITIARPFLITRKKLELLVESIYVELLEYCLRVMTVASDLLDGRSRTTGALLSIVVDASAFFEPALAWPLTISVSHRADIPRTDSPFAATLIFTRRPVAGRVWRFGITLGADVA